jgi:hypothetical protein
MKTLLGLGGDCLSLVSSYLTTAEVYRVIRAFEGRPKDIEVLSSFLITGIRAINVNTGDTLRSRMKGLSNPALGDFHEDDDESVFCREALRWAIRSIPLRDLREIRLYGMNDAVDFWEQLEPRLVLEGEGETSTNDDFGKVEVLHCDMVYPKDLCYITGMASRGVLRNLRSLHLVMVKSFDSWHHNVEGKVKYDPLYNASRLIGMQRQHKQESSDDTTTTSTNHCSIRNSRVFRLLLLNGGDGDDYYRENEGVEVDAMHIKMIQDHCLCLEEIGDMWAWEPLYVTQFIDSTLTAVPAGRWPCLKKLEVGAMFHCMYQGACNGLTPQHHDHTRPDPRPFYLNGATSRAAFLERYMVTNRCVVRWLADLRAIDDALDSGFSQEEACDERELAALIVISSLKAGAFPSLEELTLDFAQLSHVEDFFFVWAAFVFHVRLAALYENSSPARKAEIWERSPKVRGFIGNSFLELPVSRGIKKIKIVCSRLDEHSLFNPGPGYQNLYEDQYSGRYGDDYMQDHCFSRVNERMQRMDSLRAELAYYPELLSTADDGDDKNVSLSPPHCLFPDLEEVASNCGLPWRGFVDFLKGEEHAHLRRLRLFSGIEDWGTLNLFSDSLLINVENVELLPDMGCIPRGFAENALASMDLSEEWQRCLYRTWRGQANTPRREIDRETDESESGGLCHLGGPFTDIYWERDHFNIMSSRGGMLDYLMDGNAYDNNNRVVAHGATGPQRTDQAKLAVELHDYWRYGTDRANSIETGEEDCVILREREDHDERLAIEVRLSMTDRVHNPYVESRTPKYLASAWLYAVKNNCFASAKTMGVHDWLFSMLCCLSAHLCNHSNVGMFQFETPKADFFERCVYPFDRTKIFDHGGKHEVMAGGFRYVLSLVDSTLPTLESMKHSVLIKTAQLFCHMPCLERLIITIVRAGMFSGHYHQHHKHPKILSIEEDNAMTETKKQYVLCSIRALVEAICELKHRAMRNEEYQNHARGGMEEPYLPDNVRYCGQGDSDLYPDDEDNAAVVPVACAELGTLQLVVPEGHSAMYSQLREELLRMSFDGASGTTVPEKVFPLTEAAAAVAGYTHSLVKDAYTGGYSAPLDGDSVRCRLLTIDLCHGSRETVRIYVWKDV